MTVSTCPDNGLDRPDGMPIERFVDTPVENLHQILMERRGEGPFRETPASGFVRTIAHYSDEELLWRAARGGPTAAEIRRVAALSGQEVTDEQVEQTREQMRVGQLWEVDEALRERFLDDATMSAREWDEMRDDVVFVVVVGGLVAVGLWTRERPLRRPASRRGDRSRCPSPRGRPLRW